MYTRAGLIQEVINLTTKPDYLFFWGHKPHPSGNIVPSCLSQWYPAPFTVNDVIYPTAEHWMMARKASIFKDREAYIKILSTDDPREAKSIGKTVKNFDTAIWDRKSSAVVIAGNNHKFSQNRQLGLFLLGTAGKVLVEASPYDRIWGVGMEARDPDIRDPRLWKGENKLGFALMEVRDNMPDLIFMPFIKPQ